jgi:hypothetical protein
MPPYNLGTGYTCDAARKQEYSRCRGAGGSPQQCQANADAVRNQCRQNPCPYVYDRCKRNPCTPTTNDWDCWQKTSRGCSNQQPCPAGQSCLAGACHKYGYDEWQNGQWTFVPAPNGIDQPTWEGHCTGQYNRCVQGLNTPPGGYAPPIAPDFCSATCYGDNCHHAAQRVCDCLQNFDNTFAGPRSNPKVVVFGYGGNPDLCPAQPGDINHSVVSIDHPSRPNTRCLVESQAECNPTTGVDERCCMPSGANNWDQIIAQQGCPLSFSGPMKQPQNLKPISKFSCDDFLRKRGTCDAEAPRTTDIRRRALTPAGGQSCLMACDAQASNEYYQLCPEGTICVPVTSTAMCTNDGMDDSDGQVLPISGLAIGVCITDPAGSFPLPPPSSTTLYGSVSLQSGADEDSESWGDIYIQSGGDSVSYGIMTIH